MRVLAVDPGGTTGWCFATTTATQAALVVGESKWSLVDMDEILEKFIQGANHIDEEETAHIVYEDFSYRNASRAGLDLTPVKLIGIIEMYRERYEPFVGFHKQSAATGKAFWSDDKLKARNAYARGRKHGRDATRHLMQWLAFGSGSQYCNVDQLAIKLEVE